MAHASKATKRNPRPKKSKKPVKSVKPYRPKKRLLLPLSVAIITGLLGSYLLFFAHASFDCSGVRSYSELVTAQNYCVTPNPPLGSCKGGLDIAVAFDQSGSMGQSGDGADAVAALKTFVNTLMPSTPTYMSLTEFSGHDPIPNTNWPDAQVMQPFTNDPKKMKYAIDNMYSYSGWTDWKDGLADAYSTFDPRPAIPNLLVVITDLSVPNWPIDPNHNIKEYNPYYPMVVANQEANMIKSSGTRILVLAFTDGPPAIPADPYAAPYISGPNGGLNANGLDADYVNVPHRQQVGDTAAIATVLAGLSHTLSTCSGSSHGSGGGGGNGTGTGGTGSGSGGTGVGSGGSGVGTGGTGSGSGGGSSPQPKPNSTSVQSNKQNPSPIATAQGTRTQPPEPTPSPFYDGKQYSPGSEADSLTGSTTAAQHRERLWFIVGGTTLLLVGAGSGLYVLRRKHV